MADEAYRAVFLRVHPTGKMVLSLTTESDGREADYAELVAAELGVPALDVKVVPADTDRFGVGHGFNTSPSDGTAAAIASATPTRMPEMSVDALSPAPLMAIPALYSLEKSPGSPAACRTLELQEMPPLFTDSCPGGYCTAYSGAARAVN